MKKYQITLVKKEIYEVEADSITEARDKAFDLCDADPYAWSDNVEYWKWKDITPREEE